MCFLMMEWLTDPSFWSKITQKVPHGTPSFKPLFFPEQFLYILKLDGKYLDNAWVWD